MWELFRICSFIYWLIGCQSSENIDQSSENIGQGSENIDQGNNGNFAFNETVYHESIIDVDGFTEMFYLYTESKGKSFLFRINSEIWMISIHFDRYRNLTNGLIECLPPTDIRHKPYGKYIWSSFLNGNYDWHQFIISEKGGMVDFFMGDVYFVATKLNDPLVPVCFIDSSQKLAELNEEFGACTNFDLYYGGNKSEFDWPQFYKKYGSLIILDYYWEHRLSIGWYYGFDCTTVLNLKTVSSNGSPVVKVRKLRTCGINRLFYTKIAESIQLNLYREELEKFNILFIFAFDALIDEVRDSNNQIQQNRSVYSVIDKKDDDMVAPNSLLSEDVNYHFAIQKIEKSEFGSYHFNFTKLARADLLRRVIIDPCRNKSQFVSLIDLVNKHYRLYVEIDLLDVTLLSTYYDQSLMKLVYNFMWFEKNNRERRREFMTFLEASSKMPIGGKINKIQLFLLAATKGKKYIKNEVVKKI